MVELLLLIPEVRCSNPVIGKNCVEKTKIKKKRPGLALLKNNRKNKEKEAGNGRFKNSRKNKFAELVLGERGREKTTSST